MTGFVLATNLGLIIKKRKKTSVAEQGTPKITVLN